MDEPVLYRVDSGVAVLTLNAPERKNAFDQTMLLRLLDRLRAALSDDDVRAAVLTGAPGAFCAGADLGGMGAADDALERRLYLVDLVQQVSLTLLGAAKPTIAMINGVAAGAGLDFALACDLRYAASGVKLSAAYINIGLVPGAGGAFLLPRLVGTGQALEFLMTGRPMLAEDAARIGMVNKAVDDAELSTYTLKVAADLASKPPVAMGFLKSLVRQGMRAELPAAFEAAADAAAMLQTGSEHKRAVEAFRLARSQRSTSTSEPETSTKRG